MEYRGRAQCLVIRENKILMAQHTHGDDVWYCTPGGGIEPGETPEQAALRELREECNVCGTILKKTSEYADAFGSDMFYTFHMDIGTQTPTLGFDPELTEETKILTGVFWLSLDEIAEVDRAFLWASGLLSIPQFARELKIWSREISYPGNRNQKEKRMEL